MVTHYKSLIGTCFVYPWTSFKLKLIKTMQGKAWKIFFYLDSLFICISPVLQAILNMLIVQSTVVEFYWYILNDFIWFIVFNATFTILNDFIWFIVFNATFRKFQQYFSYIMVTSFSGGRSQSTRKEPPTMDKQLVNFITCGCESSAPFFVIYKAGHEPTQYWW